MLARMRLAPRLCYHEPLTQEDNHAPRKYAAPTEPQRTTGSVHGGSARRRRLAPLKKRARPAKRQLRRRIAAPRPQSRKRNRASGYDPLAPERVRQIIAGLDQLYPEVTCALTHRSAWELLVATILSAQSTDVRVNMVTPKLFRKVSDRPGFRRARARTVAAGHLLDRLFPQQVEVGGGRGAKDRRGFRRQRSANDGRVADPPRRSAQNGERRARNLVQEERRRRRRYARDANLAPSGTDQARRRPKRLKRI